MAPEPSSSPNSNRGGAWRRWRPRIVVSALVAVILSAAALTPWAQYTDRLSIDFLLPLRHLVFGPAYKTGDTRVSVVVMDEQTYTTLPFRGVPKVAWTKHLADVIGAIDAAGPAVIGLDQVLPTTLDHADLQPGYDRDFRVALAKSGRQGRLILGQVELSSQKIAPHWMQIKAVGGEKNLRHLHLDPDPDGVIRRHPGFFEFEDGKRLTSFAGELVKRAGGEVPGDKFLLNYNTGHEQFPIHNFAGLWACAEAGNADYFKRHFADRVVIIGDALDLEDRHVPAKRFAMPGPEDGLPPALETGCGKISKSDFVVPTVTRRTMPGVFIHATAVHNLLTGSQLVVIPAWATAVIAFALIFVFSLLFFTLPPVKGGGIALASLLTLLALAVAALEINLLIPVVTMLLLAVVAFPATYAYRFVVEDRERRWVKHAFEHFLAPEMVEELAANHGALKLGGERKEVTVFFSDIEGFTTLSEAMAAEPEKLVTIINQYLEVVTSTIETRGGYVDKFIGDAVMAVWGAPMADERAALNAVEAAIDVQAALARFNEEVMIGEYGLKPIGTRIGLNTGIAIVGNMGSKSRFNYTLTGDTVNLAARLEGANKAYGTKIMIGQETARQMRLTQATDDNIDAAASRILLRRLDRLVVKGKVKPVKVSEVLGRAGDFAPGQLSQVDDFHKGLICYYKRRFSDARALFASLPEMDGAAKLYVERCELFHDTPPPEDWDGSFVMTTK